MLYLEEARDMVTDREQVEVNKAAAALKRAQKAADKVVKAPWLSVFKDVKVKLRELRSMRTQQTKLRKALCVKIRKVTRGRRRRLGQKIKGRLTNILC